MNMIFIGGEYFSPIEKSILVKLSMDPFIQNRLIGDKECKTFDSIQAYNSGYSKSRFVNAFKSLVKKGGS